MRNMKPAIDPFEPRDPLAHPTSPPRVQSARLSAHVTVPVARTTAEPQQHQAPSSNYIGAFLDPIEPPEPIARPRYPLHPSRLVQRPAEPVAEQTPTTVAETIEPFIPFHRG